MSKHNPYTAPFDPINEVEQGSLSTTASSRIKRDLLNLFHDPPPGLYVIGDDSNIKIVHALIFGVTDTPYEGGFFYFVLKFPNDYPLHPPKVKFMTTDAGNVRFNPNLYNNGKVCLSIIDTWIGPSWSPAQHLGSVLISMQSIMNEKPYFNEPHIQDPTRQKSLNYNEYIQYQTMRVAVCDMLENKCQLNIPNQLVEIMEKSFIQFYSVYVELAKSKLSMNGKLLSDYLTKRTEQCNYTEILERLEQTYNKLMVKYNNDPVPSPTNSDASVSSLSDNQLDSSTENQDAQS